MFSQLSLLTVIGFVLEWAVMLALLIYVPRNRKPSSAIAWLLVIFFLPVVGILLFLVIGNPKLSRHRRSQQIKIDNAIKKLNSTNTNQTSHLTAAQKDRYKPIMDLCFNLTHLPASTGNSVKILPEYNKAIDDIVAEVNNAKQFVNFEYFILALDTTTQPLFDAFAAAVKRGVKVRVMYDALGSRRYPRFKEMKVLLTSIGVEWRPMLPIKLSPKNYNRPDLRNHRKIVVIDDKTAYIGSQNLIHRSYHRKDDIVYDELVAKIAGPVVRQCNIVFAGDWYTETGEDIAKLVGPASTKNPESNGGVLAQIVPSGPNYETENNAKLFVELIHAAKSRAVITNPYLVPDEPILNAIISAARRGVDISVINSEAMDQWMVGHAQRSFYAELLKAGVKIYLYKSPVLLHSKHITIDDDIAVVGSSNMDIRSFELDLECLIVAYDKTVVKELQKVQTSDLAKCRQLDAKQWAARGFVDEFRDSVARLTSALQ